MEVDAGHLDALEDADALRAREPGEVLDGLHRLGPATLPLVEDGLDPRAVPVGEDRAHVLRARLLAEDDVGAVADLGLALLDRDAVLGLHLGHRGDVADRVVAEALGIRLEELDRDANHLRHRRREVEVAHHAARDSRRACADVALLEDDDVLTGAELEGQVVGGRQAVDSATDDDVL